MSQAIMQIDCSVHYSICLVEQAFWLIRYWTIHYGVNGKLPFTLGRAQMHFFAYKIRGRYLFREANSSFESEARGKL